MLLIFLTFVVVLILWLVYACVGHIADGKDQDGNPIHYVFPGLLDVLLSPVKGFVAGADIIIYLLIMGMFLQMVNQSKALEAGIGSLVRKLKGKELIIIPVIMIFFS
ncbi:MAG: hypothetical protein LBM72_02710, partial [Mycoplasmataceae bacterium]|nr:hypothetical protein [Mycoplasmataceae bacterium]